MVWLDFMAAIAGTESSLLVACPDECINPMAGESMVTTVLFRLHWGFNRGRGFGLAKNISPVSSRLPVLQQSQHPGLIFTPVSSCARSRLRKSRFCATYYAIISYCSGGEMVNTLALELVPSNAWEFKFPWARKSSCTSGYGTWEMHPDTQ